jgi:hypothetical protein
MSAVRNLDWLAGDEFRWFVLGHVPESRPQDSVTKARRRDEEENTYDLPDGDDIAERLRFWFRRQAKRVLGVIPTIGEPLPAAGELPDLHADDEPMARGMTPLVSAYWDTAGREIRARIGLEPDAWRRSWAVTDPRVRGKIEDAAFNFCHATNATTTLDLATALEQLKEEFAAGIVEEGEAIPSLARRFRRVFEHASKSRATTIARTEASRGVHAGAYESVRESGIVVGTKWLLSSNACSLCHRIAEEVNQVPLGENFAVIGKHTDYADIKFPPAHPRCRCSTQAILNPTYDGPENPQWGTGLIQPPKDEEEDEP